MNSNIDKHRCKATIEKSVVFHLRCLPQYNGLMALEYNCPKVEFGSKYGSPILKLQIVVEYATILGVAAPIELRFFHTFSRYPYIYCYMYTII